jgi:hypothetical protein
VIGETCSTAAAGMQFFLVHLPIAVCIHLFE